MKLSTLYWILTGVFVAFTVVAAVCRFRSGGNMSSLPIMALAPCAVSLPMSSPTVTARNEGK